MSIFELFDNSYGAGTFESVPDGIGGTDIIHNGTVVDHINSGENFASDGTTLTVSNVMGGEDVISDGVVVAHTQPNVMGGMDIYDGNMDLETTTIPNVEGGVDIFDDNMDFEAMTVPNVFDGEDYLSFDGNVDDIMSNDDPLLYSSKVKLPPFGGSEYE
ncbi:MAG: hypothetical protein E7197_01965 [Anaerovibrio sp.]|uniref:hypothetical protein n=1 Tax=Anaerovibrio sp. TaxID=1872532 RepID=UPI0025C5AA6C|nr:hypothetical protein [Anaerovibrio sp.]MBE6098800.1 hypothetical protein [Anaerovibrio sp.]